MVMIPEGARVTLIEEWRTVQIHDGTRWRDLPAYDVPEELVGEVAIDVVDDPCLYGYQAAVKASNDQSSALFRLKAADPGVWFLVKMARAPSLKPDRMMTTLMTLTPAGVM